MMIDNNDIESMAKKIAMVEIITYIIVLFFIIILFPHLDTM